MLLQDVLYKVAIQSVQGSTAIDVSGIQLDSRKVTNGNIFVAVKGVGVDGHLFIDKAVENGATVVVYQNTLSVYHDNVVYITVEDTAVALGIMAANFYQNPSTAIKVVGVTGTNGKTTIATLLYKLFTSLGYKCGLLSTVNNIVAGHVLEATHTTPDGVSLQALLRNMANEGCEYVFMEVSSHAVHQHRIAGLHFAGGLFSNITHDHLDYHKTFDEYIRVKKMFFDGLGNDAFAITNVDDKRGLVMLQNTQAKKYSYSIKTLADFKGKLIENNLTGLVLSVNDLETHFRLIGEFNAYNLLAVYGAAICLGQDKMEVLQHLSMLTGAEGRFDFSVSPKEQVITIVDYAHTPDALLNVLATIKKLKQGNEKVITVVGCGGDRDKTKRPVMATVACEHSDKVVFTSDNPRTEDAAQIIKDMEEGLPAAARRKYLAITDRREAIKTAVSLANPGDIVLIAGKGHEKYQDINGVKNHFDDKEVVQEMIDLLEK